ncbi:MAG: hypothetical protein K9N23_16055 [Akkermansiaceae bacterium]|nr:hypothetical protein [Akkermansiaceae bacterium]MCF7733205.1 hypothetical protein [Akkermansiaceae bacterium]
MLRPSDGLLTLKARPAAIAAARLLHGDPVPFIVADGTLTLPANAWPPIATIVELTMAGSTSSTPPKAPRFPQSGSSRQQRRSDRAREISDQETIRQHSAFLGKWLA